MFEKLGLHITAKLTSRIQQPGKDPTLYMYVGPMWGRWCMGSYCAGR